MTQTLDYDKAHRLTTVAGGGDTTGFLYDADGNRARSTNNGTNTFQWGDWTWTTGDDPEMVYRIGGALVATRDGDGKLWWSIDDHLSSTTVQYHAGTGTVRHQRYLPFGKVRIDDGVTTDVGYTGQRLDTTGLMFYQARYYDPLIGRFTSADTIVPDPANPQDLSRYTYVNNNPLKYTDPTGHCAFGLPCPGFIEDAKDTAGEVLSAGAELVTDVGGVVADAGAYVAGGVDRVWDGAWEYGEYKIDRVADEFRDLVLDPSLGDMGELLFPIEEVVNEIGVVVGIAGGGDVIAGDSSGSDCPIGATCVRDAARLPFEYGGQAFNEVLVTTADASDQTKYFHEPQHFYDADQYGWAPYAAAYVLNGLRHGLNFYEHNRFEHRGRSASIQHRRQSPWSIWDLFQ